MPRKTKNKKGRRKRGRPPKNRIYEKNKRETSKRATIMRNAPKHHYFILCNGKPVKNVKELADIMEDLEDQVFDHHVGPDRNDFAKWIKDIFKDIELAEKIAGVKDKKHMQLAIYKHITHKAW